MTTPAPPPDIWTPSDKLLIADPIAEAHILHPHPAPGLVDAGVTLPDPALDDDDLEAAAAAALAELDDDDTPSDEPGDADDDDAEDDPDDPEGVIDDL